MKLQFTKTNEGYVAEFEAPCAFNLHIKRETAGLLEVFQRTVPNGNYDSVDMSKYFNREHKTIDCEFSGAVYPKYIKVVSQVEVISAEVTKPAKSGDLQLKQVTITDNGTQSVIPDAEFSGLSKVVVNTDVNTLQGLDFGENQFGFDFNDWIKRGIEEIPRIQEWLKMYTAGSYDYAVQTLSNNRGYFVVFFPYVEGKPKPTSARSMFSACYNLLMIDDRWDFSESIDMTEFCSQSTIMSLKNINLNATKAKNWNYFAQDCYNLKDLPDNINSISAKNFNSAFFNCRSLERISIATDSCETMQLAFSSLRSCKEILLTSVAKCTNFTNTFSLTYSVKVLHFTEWKQTDINLVAISDLLPESIHYIIQNSVNLADGATARILTLHATAKTNWQNSEYYEQDLAVLSTKGITIA